MKKIKLTESQLTEIISQVISEAYSGGKIMEDDIPCDIWCKRKAATRGSRGDVVRMIQHLLARGCGEYGPYNPEKMGGGMNEGCAENWTNCDGKYEKETKKAVEQLQENLQLKTDGKVGFDTLTALCGICDTPATGQNGILCDQQCKCDQQGTDTPGGNDSFIEIVDGDDWFIDIDISPEYGNDCDRIKACLKYAINQRGEHWHYFKECMTRKHKDKDTNEGCAGKCAQGCPQDPPAGTPVTAVMSWCWNGTQCRQLSWGGGPWYSKEACEECCENKGGNITNKL